MRFARAFARSHARLVVLDEALRGLDRTQRHRLLGRAREQWASATMLCATHDVGEALAFDRVIVLDEGQVVEDGDPRALARDPGSRLAAMIAAERSLRDQLDGDERGWRRVRVQDAGVGADGARSAVPAAGGPRPGHGAPRGTHDAPRPAQDGAAASTRRDPRRAAARASRRGRERERRAAARRRHAAGPE